MENIPRHIQEIPFHTPVLEWLANECDHVFVALSPFFRVEGFSPETAAFGPVYVNRTTIKDIMEFVKSPSTPRPNEAPDDFDQTIKTHGECVSWAKVQSAIGVTDFMEFSRAAWLWSVCSPRVKDHALTVEKIEAYCKDHNLYSPEEDHMPLILEPIIESYLGALGIEGVTAYNEFRNVKHEVPVTEFSANRPPVVLRSGPHSSTDTVCAIVSDTPKLMFHWGHDDVSGLLCITDEARKLADPAKFFEGFYVTADMYCDWLNPVDFFERNPPSKVM